MTTTNNTNKCPKCSSTMTQHPSVVSMPLSSSSPIVRGMKNINMHDQNAILPSNLSLAKSVDIANSIYLIVEITQFK